MNPNRGKTIALIAGVACLVVVGLALVIVAGRWGELEREAETKPPAIDLSGNWPLTFPRGATRRMQVVAAGEGRYVIAAAGVLDGEYEVRGDRLVITQPRDRRMVGLEWQILDQFDLTLVAEPLPWPTGSSYAGATASRPDPSERFYR